MDSLRTSTIQHYRNAVQKVKELTSQADLGNIHPDCHLWLVANYIFALAKAR